MQGDDPPYLSVGTAVSAKYKGAFCEAKVSKVVRVVKCKVTYKMGLGTATVSDEQIKGPLRVGQLVQAKHMEKKEFVDATIAKIQDCSQYTVVFDDGDITTLRRTALCLKSGRHFNESETLDQLPLTHPEHFGNPVVGGRRGRRSRQPKEDSSEGEAEEENEPDLEVYITEVGRVVCVEASDKKRNKDNWFPGLVVMPSAQPTVRINVKDEFLVRSFKDGRYYTVPQKEVTEFSREMMAKIESTLLAEAVEKAVRYLDNDELPAHWERTLLFNNSTQTASSDSDEHYTDSSDDETPEEKDHFVAQLYKFMDDSNTPLNKNPAIGNKDVDLHRLFRVVRKLGGYNRVTNKNKWRSVTLRMKLPNNLNIYNQVKLVYKKCLLSYEAFHRTLGVTMLSHPRNAKKSRGRSLIRDKDRSTPVNSPRPDKEEESMPLEKKEEEKPPEEKPKVVKKFDFKPKPEEEKKPKEAPDVSDTNSSDTVDLSEVTSNVSVRLRRADSKSSRERKAKPATGEKVKAIVEKFEEQAKKKEEEKEKEDDKTQQTRSKTQAPKIKEKEVPPDKKVREIKTPVQDPPSPSKTPTKPIKKVEDDKKRGRKRTITEDKEKASQSDSGIIESTPAKPPVGIGDKLKVYYGPTHESKVTYEAKVIEIDKEAVSPMYLVHYTGWNTRYDEWISPTRIAENLSATTKAKKLKQSSAAAASKASTPKSVGKRGRRMSITGRSTAQEGPRSTTPSSITSTSGRTKSPGTPATRTFRATRQGELNRRTRRTSAQTDVSNHSESDSEGTESDSDMVRTRSVVKSEDGEGRLLKRKLIKPSLKGEKRKDKEDEETEKEDELPLVDRPKRTRRLKKMSESKGGADSDDDSGSPPKGRDFDLNQIRSELKGFAVKAVKLAGGADANEKETLSSDESSNLPDAKSSSCEPEETEKVKANVIQKSLSSDDIYEFKEPEPFEFETRPKLVDDKNKKRLLVPRIFDEIDKSPKKRKTASPAKLENKEEVEVEKKRLRRTPVKKPDLLDDDDDEDDDELSDNSSQRSLIEDPFDKLVESPSFHSGREKLPSCSSENKQKSVKSLNLDEPLSLFHGLSETAEDDSGDQLDISDTEEPQNEPLFTHKEQLFSEASFAKASPDRTTLDPIFRGFIPKVDDRKQKDSDDDDAIRASIQSVINQTSSTDDDSNDVLLINPPPFLCFQDTKTENKAKTPTITLSSTESEEDVKPVEVVPIKIEPKDPKPMPEAAPPPTVKQISPALQETDTSLLEEVISSVSQSEILTKLDETKDISIKTGTKIADTLLQKLSMIKSAAENKFVKEDPDSDDDDDDDDEEETKPEIEIKPEPKLEVPPVPKEEPKKIEPKPKPTETKPKQPEPKLKTEPKSKTTEIKAKPPESRFKIEPKIKTIEPKIKTIEPKIKTIEPKIKTIEPKIKTIEPKIKTIEPKMKTIEPKIKTIEPKLRPSTTKSEIIPEVKKRTRKIVSREFIEESDTDSTDSEERLVIARSDEESQTNSSSDIKSDLKETTNSNPDTVEDPQSIQSECSFKFDVIKKPEPDLIKTEIKPEVDSSKEEEPDSHLHSLLLCEETIPGSPAPAPEGPSVSESKPKSKSVLEMPFASAPGSSNNKSEILTRENKIMNKERVQPPPLVLPLDNREKEGRETSTVLDNTPPTTPESTLSNLSPRGDPGELSPNTADDSCKSGDGENDYPIQRRSSANKLMPLSMPYNEGRCLDSLLNAAESASASNSKKSHEMIASPCRKRRRSCKGPDDIPAKRGRKPANRSRHNSDSDDTSEHSMPGGLNLGPVPGLDGRLTRSPRPSKYNYFIELDPALDSGQRIAILQQKLQEIRKTYADVKAELAAVERRRKKLRRREREAKLAAKQESLAT